LLEFFFVVQKPLLSRKAFFPPCPTLRAQEIPLPYKVPALSSSIVQTGAAAIPCSQSLQYPLGRLVTIPQSFSGSPFQRSLPFSLFLLLSHSGRVKVLYLPNFLCDAKQVLLTSMTPRSNLVIAVFRRTHPIPPPPPPSPPPVLWNGATVAFPSDPYFNHASFFSTP